MPLVWNSHCYSIMFVKVDTLCKLSAVLLMLRFLSSYGLFSLLVVSWGECYTFSPLWVSNYQGCREGPWLCDLGASSRRVVSEWHTSKACLFTVVPVSGESCHVWGQGLRGVFGLRRSGGFNRVPETPSLYTGLRIHFKIKLTVRKQMFS